MFPQLLAKLSAKMQEKKNPGRPMTMGIQGKPSFKSTLTSLAQKRRFKTSMPKHNESAEMEY